MKKTFVISICFSLLVGSLVWAGEPSFETFQEVVKNAVPGDFPGDQGKVKSRRFFYIIEYSKDETRMQTFTFELNPRSQNFSAMQLAMDHKEFDFDGRKAIFVDGSKTGMSSISIILNNNGGRFTIRHKYLGGTAWDKAGLEKVLAKIKFPSLEQ